MSHHEPCCSFNKGLNQRVCLVEHIHLVFCYGQREEKKAGCRNETDEQRIPAVTFKGKGKYLVVKHVLGLNDLAWGQMTEAKHNNG